MLWAGLQRVTAVWDCDRDANAGVMRCAGLLKDVTPAPEALPPVTKQLGCAAV